MIKNLIFALSGLAFIGCSNAPDGEKAEVSDQVETTQSSTGGQSYTIDVDNSLLFWQGSKPTGKHEGSIKVLSGEIRTDGNELTKAVIEMDMNSIQADNMAEEDKANLEGHLKNEDFFDVGNFPTAKFEMTKLTKLENDPTGVTHLIYGNMTIKDVTKNIGVKASIKTGDNLIAIKIPSFKIDRSEFNVKYKSKKFFDNLKDNFIHDEIGLSIQILATK